MIGNVHGLVSNGSRSLGNSYVFDIINAGKITEIILIQTIPRVIKKAVYVTNLLDICSLIYW